LLSGELIVDGHGRSAKFAAAAGGCVAEQALA
jgi:hypothetical protein